MSRLDDVRDAVGMAPAKQTVLKGVEMGNLRILADGNSAQEQANARGKLFEKLMTDVLRSLGYKIDRMPNVNYAGLEIDIEGWTIVTGIPLYAECKCYSTEVDSPKLQQFFGEYMTRWMKDRKSHGLFIALPGINSHAKGFYNENCRDNSEITLKLLEEDSVLKLIYESQQVVPPETISISAKTYGTPGEVTLLYTPKGLFWGTTYHPK